MGYFCPEPLLCKSSNEKKSEICIREQFVTWMVQYGGKIENGNFDNGKDANVGLVWNVFIVMIYKAISFLERGAKIQDLHQIFESVT